MDWARQRITAALTKAQVEKSPDIDTDKPVSRQHETAYYGYYGYTPYWAGSYLWGAYPYPYLGSGPALSAADLAREQRWHWEAKEREDPRLRSSRAVTGYHIQATDGEIGHVEDFLVDEHFWAIRYMLVDTTNTLDQFFRVEEGTGEAVLDGVRTTIRTGFAVVIPAGTTHNIINTDSVPLKLYSLYAPPNHRAASATIPAKTRRPTTITSTARRQNSASTARRADLRRSVQVK
jgi:mannose-6-phosphate isomerase-like protein (cupin superfamily)